MLLKNQVETFYKSTTNIKTEFCIDIDSLFKDDETGKMWYDVLDSDGEYIRIPRVLDGEPLKFDIASESAIEEPA